MSGALPLENDHDPAPPVQLPLKPLPDALPHSLPTPPIQEPAFAPLPAPAPTPAATADLDNVVGAGVALDGLMDAELEDALAPDGPPPALTNGAPPAPVTPPVSANGTAAVPDVLLAPVAPADAQALAEQHVAAAAAAAVAPSSEAEPTALPSASAVPPPPAFPLPSHLDIPDPPIRTDSVNSLAVEPPTPAPLVPEPTPSAPPAVAPAAVTAPTPVTEDAPMPDNDAPGEPAAPEATLKRSAPEEGPTALAQEDEREVKRPKVEEQKPSLDPDAPVPATGYDPSAFTSAPAPPLAPAPTVSPSDLLHPSASASASPSPAALPAPLAGTAAAPATVPSPQPPADASQQQPGGEGPVAVLTRNQHKFCVSLVRSLKKHRSIAPFLRPVDPVALLIPDYPRVITRPMDLGTVDAKLAATGKAMAHAAKLGRVFGVDYTLGAGGPWEGQAPNVYRTADEFRADVELIWDNCFRYNGPKDKNPVSQMAGQLQEVTDKAWKAMPSAPPVEYKPEPPRPPTPEVVVPVKERRPSQSFVPTIRRSEDGARPKREIHAPARELPYEEQQQLQVAPRSRHVSTKSAQEQLRFCKEVIRELFKKTHEAYAFPFYSPVDIVALNIPQYPTVVKKPMDLGTVRTRLETGQYPMPPYAAFESDVRLVFKNCYAFNPPGTVVHDWGRKLEAVFDAKWAERPLSYDDDDDDMSDDDGITEMERQLQTMQANLEAMKAKKLLDKQKRAAERAQRPPKPSASKKASTSDAAPRKSSSSSTQRKRPSGGATGGAKKKKSKRAGSSDDDFGLSEPAAPGDDEVVTFDMKRELAVKIVAFEGDNLERAIDIIRQGRPDLLSDVNKEIELDIDQLDQRTLLNLYRFVCPSPTRKPSKPANRRTATGGTKRKNLDEIKESERIEMLEARLREFENGGAGAAGGGDSRRSSAAADDQASSSSESEDGSDSESEDDD